MTITIIIIVVIGIILISLISIYNSLVVLKNRVKNAWSQIDVQLKRRHDLIPNLIETVKGYMDHERETLEAVVKARSAAMSAGSITEKAEAENLLTSALGKLNVVVESYPTLVANQNFLAHDKIITTRYFSLITK